MENTHFWARFFNFLYVKASSKYPIGKKQYCFMFLEQNIFYIKNGGFVLYTTGEKEQSISKINHLFFRLISKQVHLLDFLYAFEFPTNHLYIQFENYCYYFL